MRKKFGKKMTIINGKKVSRVLMGSSREGSVMYLQITPKELLECVLITYQHNGNTFCVLTQQVVTRTLEAEAYFDQIQNSLKADNIQP